MSNDKDKPYAKVEVSGRPGENQKPAQPVVEQPANESDEVAELRAMVAKLQMQISSNATTPAMKTIDEGLSKEGLIETEFSMADAELEAFMHEIVVIELAESNDENVNPLPFFTVGEERQLMPPGYRIGVKRKFVEALARCKYTLYKFVRPDPANPDYQEKRGKTALLHPFSVHMDKNPRGAAWLRAILSEAA